jgi:hypothetical protein
MSLSSSAFVIFKAQGLLLLKSLRGQKKKGGFGFFI